MLGNSIAELDSKVFSPNQDSFVQLTMRITGILFPVVKIITMLRILRIYSMSLTGLSF